MVILRRLPFRRTISVWRAYVQPGISSHLQQTRSFSERPYWKRSENFDEWLVHPDLKEHIRGPSESRSQPPDDRSTDFSVLFLGTGAGRGSLLRGNAATAVRTEGSIYLFDCGEGTQRQLEYSSFSLGAVQKIFVTHMHGDHVLGLPGLLLSLQESAKNTRFKHKKRVQVFGPVGLYNFIATSLSLINVDLRHLTVEVFELTEGSIRRRHPGSLLEYREFRNTSLHRKSIARNGDGTWTLGTANSDARYSNKKGVLLKAAEIEHLPKLHCFGYVLEEPPQQRPIDVHRCIDLGIKPGGKLRLLKSGISVKSDDGLRTVNPEDVLIGDEPRKARKFALLGDCCHVPQPMADISRNADVLVHEATLIDDDALRGGQGHSTPAMAGRFANAVGANVLALNHLGLATASSVNGYSLVSSVVRSACAEIQVYSPTRVQATYDHMEIIVPHGGFSFSSEVDLDVSESSEMVAESSGG